MSRPHSRTGRKRYWVTFQIPVIAFSTDGTQTPTTTWVNTYSTWGEIAQTSGGEVVWPQQVQAEEVYLIYCRWFVGAAQAERVIYQTRIFNIIQSNNVGGLNQELQISCCSLDPDA